MSLARAAIVTLAAPALLLSVACGQSINNVRPLPLSNPHPASLYVAPHVHERIGGGDVFALDPDNGLLTELPLFYSRYSHEPDSDLFERGFTGLMLPLDGSTSWSELFDPDQLATGAATGLLRVEAVQPGLSNGFMFGVNADTSTPPFVVSTLLLPPWFEVGGSATAPQTGQFFGAFLGNGDQHNYLMIALAGRGSGEILVELRVDGARSTARFGPEHWDGSELLGAASIELFLQLDPHSGAVQPQLSLDGGITLHSLGTSWVVPPAWLSPDDNRGLAIGAISSSGQSGQSFGATWGHFRVAHVAGSAAGEWNLVDDYDQPREQQSVVQQSLLGDALVQATRPADADVR